MSQPIKVRFSNFLSEIEQMEEDNKTLTEDIRVLEKEKAESYSKFDTETHILVDREKLSMLKSSLVEASYSCVSTQDEASGVESCANDVRSSAGYARDEVENAQESLREILKEVETAK